MRKTLVGMVLVTVTAMFPLPEVAGQGFKGPAVVAPLDARTRRALRERAVLRAGPGSRNFVEENGDVAALAILRCSPNVGRMLAKAHDDGDLGLIPDSPRLLQLVAHPRCGDDVALWILNHLDDLRDADALEVFLNAPLEHAMRLRKLEDGIAEVRGNRHGIGDLLKKSGFPTDPMVWIIIASFVGPMILLHRWFTRKKEREVRPHAPRAIEMEESWESESEFK